MVWGSLGYPDLEKICRPVSLPMAIHQKKCDAPSDNGLPPIFSFWEVAGWKLSHSKFTWAVFKTPCVYTGWSIKFPGSWTMKKSPVYTGYINQISELIINRGKSHCSPLFTTHDSCHPGSSFRGTPDFCTARANPFWLPANTWCKMVQILKSSRSECWKCTLLRQLIRIPSRYSTCQSIVYTYVCVHIKKIHMYLYIYMCVCLYIYIRACVYTYIYIYIYIYNTYIHMCAYIWKYTCVSINIYIYKHCYRML